MASDKKYKDRQRILQILFAIGGLVLLFKAAQLQIFDNTFRERARTATIDKQLLYPSRGLIYDRNGELLVYNDALYDLEVIYKQIDPDMDTALFCELLDISRQEFKERLDVDWSSSRYAKSVPFTFLKRIKPHKFSSFLEHQHRFPGFLPVLKNTRGYQHEVGAHVLGYISEVGPEHIKDSSGTYIRGDNIGTSGLEKTHEDKLRGSKGMRYVLKDKWGRNVGAFNEGILDTSAQSGNDLLISIDHKLQAYGEQLMQGKKGSIVAIEPETGEILSMVSAPYYDPSDLAVDRNRNEAFQRISADSLQPFFNRAVSAQYPPGSVFKPVLALVGLQQDMIAANDWHRCTGAYYYKDVSWGCHGDPGLFNVTTAIQHSCNTYFYDLYKRMVEKYGWSNPGKGLDEMNELLAQFGLGQKLNVDLPNEHAGLLPGSDYYADLYDYQEADWRSTYIISNGIGQGELQLTTLQMANMAAVIANRGFYINPHFIKAFKNSQKKIPQRYRKKNEVDIDQQHFKPVIDGLEKAVAEGTARLAYIPGTRVCGKTGTSENPHGKDHSVFFAFAPRENPQIAIAVYIENGGWGGSYAAPIASLMIEKYLNGEIKERRKWIENRMLSTNLIVNP
jgi:penicillin-binding protein 2